MNTKFSQSMFGRDVHRQLGFVFGCFIKKRRGTLNLIRVHFALKKHLFSVIKTTECFHMHLIFKSSIFSSSLPWSPLSFVVPSLHLHLQSHRFHSRHAPLLPPSSSQDRLVSLDSAEDFVRLAKEKYPKKVGWETETEGKMFQIWRDSK